MARRRRRQKKGRLIPATARGPHRDEKLRAAVALHEQGQLSEAAELYRLLLEADPDDADALHLGGLLAHQRGDSEAGIRAIRRAIEVAGEHPATLGNLGNVLLESGDPNAAVSAFEGALALDPDQPTVAERLATALKRLGRLNDAVEQYRRAVQLASTAELPAPLQGRLQTNLGIALLDHGETEAALVSLRMAVDTAPDLAVAHNNLGVGLRAAGELEAALSTFAHAESLSRGAAWSAVDRARLWINLGDIQEQRGDLDAAEKSFDRALGHQPHEPAALAGLGTVAKRRGDRPGALGWFSRATELSPSSAAAQNNLGSALCDLERFDEAITTYRRAIELDPRCWDAYANLTRLYRRLSRGDEAQALYVAWLDRDPDNPIAQHMVAAARGENPRRASDAYVQQTFDNFATNFGDVLAGLDYRAPELLKAAVAAAGCEPNGSHRVLDAGCGTGLCAGWLADYAEQLIGVDLSPRMLERAEALGLYQRLETAELTKFLNVQPNAFDLIVAADVLVYFGALDTALAAAAAALRPKGLIAFTLERGDAPTFALHPTGRYSHGESYVRQGITDAALEIVALDADVLRREQGEPVEGWVVVARRP